MSGFGKASVLLILLCFQVRWSPNLLHLPRDVWQDAGVRGSSGRTQHPRHTDSHQKCYCECCHVQIDISILFGKLEYFVFDLARGNTVSGLQLPGLSSCPDCQTPEHDSQDLPMLAGILRLANNLIPFTVGLCGL